MQTRFGLKYKRLGIRVPPWVSFTLFSDVNGNEVARQSRTEIACGGGFVLVKP